MRNTKLKSIIKQYFSVILRSISRIVNIITGDLSIVSFQNKMFIVGCIFSILFALLAIFWNYTLGLSKYLNITVGFAIVAFAILYYFARFKHIYGRISLSILMLLLISIAWIVSEGSKGSIPLLYILAIVFFITVSKSNNSFLYLLITILNIIILLFIEYFFPDYIIKYPNEEAKVLDIYFGYITTFVLIYFFISYYRRSYDKENETTAIQKKELQKLNSTKDKFFSIIAHDLRSPFNSFLGLTDILADKSSNLKKNEMQIIVASLNKSATNLYQLLENLLDWSRVQRGSLSSNPVTIHLHKFIVQNIDLIRESYNKKGIEINIDILDDVVVYADKSMLQSVIGNLVSNALKFTPIGGSVFISTKLYSSQSIEISIKDTGIGMSKEIFEDLFKIDKDVSREGTENEHGTGLGLLLCKEFIEKLGGEIWVESKINEGSIFKFTLPIQPTDNE
ncbi:MAG: HAMP domain-containing sensor histidine kinase [Bacteroidales bacterium]|jgi:two-component system sensor histidine kinase/response regulator|nr:HAMP domain-containing sensor histidine kinase [Bacteroidales bacterium]